MKIMVFDVAAETGGALSILEEFYNETVKHEDKNIEWIFVLSKPTFKETDNVKIIRFPWIKKSWIHRIFFDYIIAPKLVRKYSPDEVLSLQNVIIPRIKKVKQVLYVHQSLPFVNYKFSFKENKKFWIYEKIIRIKILNSIKKSDQVIVQTQWMKKLCTEKTNVKAHKIVVRPPKIEIYPKKVFEFNEKSLKTFFYPASGHYYKNHRLIVKACERLKKYGVSDYEVIFTLKGDENEHIASLYNIVKNNDLPIKFIGSLTKEEVFDFYTKSILIFPSYIESVGLPLLEAKKHETPILASDCAFSHEILSEYKNSYFFNPFDEIELAELMKNINYKIIQNNED